jgi:hypothetical protein
MPYDGGNATGFPSPATIYLEAVIDLAAILDLRKPSRYPVRVVGGALPARGIADKDILVVDCALDRAPGSGAEQHYEISHLRKFSNLMLTRAQRFRALLRLPPMLALCAVGLLSLSACKRAPIKPQPPNVTFVIVRSASITPTEYLQGRAAAHTVVDIRPQVNGELDAQLFKDGSQVTAGQPLFQIDNVPYQAAYDSATAVLENAQTNLDLAEAKAKRARELLRQSAISKQEYDVAEAGYKQARAQTHKIHQTRAATRQMEARKFRASLS